MMDFPLNLNYILRRAQQLYPRKEIATKVGSAMHRYTYADFYQRVNRLAYVLDNLGVGPGDRVGTFAWNTHRHLEAYFAIPCKGSVLHTLNIRLFPEQIVYIINHAEDKVILVDQTLLPLLEKLASRLPTVKHYIVMGDSEYQTTLTPHSSYEQLLRDAPSGPYPWPEIPENQAAAMCYTSGTTGNPKGVLYSHRAIVLHSFSECMADSVGLTERDTVMPVVPMFHANAWGLPFAATMVGSRQVYPGPHLQPRDLAELIQEEKVTVAAGVPTIWLGLYHLLERERYDISSLRVMPVGGSAAPRSMIEGYQKNLGAYILHAWGMTEMTPIGTVSQLKSHMLSWPEDEQFAVRAKQGVMVPGVELRGVDNEGREIPWDGQTMGELQVRGPWIIREYYREANSSASFMDGWFRTGDVVTIDPEGFIQIVDRTKDLVKSGGEWISTVDLESQIMGHPKVLEAAVIAVSHPKWLERPLACVVPKPDFKDHINKEEIIEYLSSRVARWWLPDDVVFIESVPKTSVGKFDKKILRERFKHHILPEM
ncbi:MAG: long-chain fatty acid--CoA ligase [Chloroflexi bacterium]|nr:long-chain fatty acid--CoA ligase [Chloroflexota bacterium]